MKEGDPYHQRARLGREAPVPDVERIVALVQHSHGRVDAYVCKCPQETTVPRGLIGHRYHRPGLQAMVPFHYERRALILSHNSASAARIIIQPPQSRKNWVLGSNTPSALRPPIATEKMPSVNQATGRPFISVLLLFVPLYRRSTQEDNNIGFLPVNFA